MLQTVDIAQTIYDRSLDNYSDNLQPERCENVDSLNERHSSDEDDRIDEKAPYLPQEVVDYQMAVGSREMAAEKRFLGLAAYLASPSVRSLQFDPPGVLPLGKATHFVLRRSRRRYRGRVAIRLVGYKAQLSSEGRIVLGGSQNTVCCYDFRLAPTPKPVSGTRLDFKKRSSIRVGLRLDAAVELAQQNGGLHARLDLPIFLAAFRPDSMPLVEDTPFARNFVRRVLRPGSEHYVPPVVSSPGGTIQAIDRDNDGKYLIDFGLNQPVVEMPYHVVLHPFTKVGVEFAPGTSLADLLPRIDYGTWPQIVRATGSEQAAQFVLQQCALACDYLHQNNVWLLRDARLIPSHLLEAKQIFEYISLDSTDNTYSPCVVYDGPGLLQFTDGPIDVDFLNLPTRWESRFQN